MIKRTVSIILCVLLLSSLSLSVFAQEDTAAKTVTIKDPEELIALAERCRLDTYSVGLTVQLLRDIDLTGFSFESIPVFNGTFNGNGHNITGLVIQKDGSAQGLFRYLTNSAIVRDLHISAEIIPGGSRGKIGGFAGENSGLIQNCGFSGTVIGGDHVGGITGINTVTGIIEDCSVTGQLQGIHFAGGIAGTNNGVIRFCTNNAAVNITPQQNTVDLDDITIDSITDSEATNTVTDIGGIAGISTGVIRECENRANIGYKHMGYNIGGIAGTQSGYIIRCTNYAQIEGRKEIGGIVGQMEPVTYIEYSTDTFQILKEQLGEMSEMVNKVAANAQGNASGVSGHIGTLQGQAQTAWQAIDALIPESGSEELPDQDAVMAAFSTVSSAMSQMPQTINNIGYALQSTISGLTRDLGAISRHITEMGKTLDSAAETMGGSFTDVSDADSEELFSGKVAQCINYGSVLGDLNVGGIAGAVSMENDLDIMEDWTQNGDSSLNFDGRIRSVVLTCKNEGPVTGKTQHIGGVVGWLSLGLIRDSYNCGNIEAPAADYVGGVTGRSSGFIRGSGAKCRITGSTCVGGIAGSAAIVSDCRSMVVLDSGTEKLGSILGIISEQETEDEQPIRDNFSYEPFRVVGAIDGINYSGCAESLDSRDFLELDNLPDMFSEVNVRFVFPDGSEIVRTVAPGGKLNERRIPDLPVTDGLEGIWEGLDEIDLKHIPYDITFHAVYPSKVSVISCTTPLTEPLPQLLLEGSFLPGAQPIIDEEEDKPAAEKNQTLLSSWKITVPESSTTVTARLYIGNVDSDITVMRQTEAGDWIDCACHIDGRYAVFQVPSGESTVAVIQDKSVSVFLLLIPVAVLLVALAVTILVRKKKK